MLSSHFGRLWIFEKSLKPTSSVVSSIIVHWTVQILLIYSYLTGSWMVSSFEGHPTECWIHILATIWNVTGWPCIFGNYHKPSSPPSEATMKCRISLVGILSRLLGVKHIIGHVSLNAWRYDKQVLCLGYFTAGIKIFPCFLLPILFWERLESCSLC